MTSLSTTDVLPLADHRTRRRQRLRLVQSLQGMDERRSALVSHLGRVAELVSADRVATLWVDEYGPEIPHPHLVLDLLSDRPRRGFRREPLYAAQENGVPGVHEYRHGTHGHPGGWGMVVSLGSDGTRAWFLVADAVTPRPTLSEFQRGEALFLSGECSAVLLHQDLDQAGEKGLPSAPEAEERRFPGWHVLRDLEGRDDDGEEGRRIALRFVVARLPMLLLEDDLAVPDERRAEQARRARDEVLLREGKGGPEQERWDAVLTAFEGGELPALARELLALGLDVADQGHAHGAGELLATAYQLAAAVGEIPIAVDAARMAGRTARRRGAWKDAHRWYDVAREITQVLGWSERTAVVLDGIAATHRERGNLPAARETLERALAAAEESGDAVTIGRVHHGFLGLEQAAGKLDRAAHHGWRAVSLYEDDGDRTRGFAGLAALFQEMGRLDAAEDAWLLVRHLSKEEYYTLYAVDALSHISALKGDAAAFAHRAAESDALGWDVGPKGAKAEILLHRGLSYQALGRDDEARRWLRRAVAFAEEAGFTQTLFEAERALKALDSDAARQPLANDVPPHPEAIEVEERLHAMRRELVGAPG